MASFSGPSSSSSTVSEEFIDSEGKHYRTEKEIGSGLETKAYLARELSSGEYVVIKQQKKPNTLEKESNNKRELQCLAKEGTLLGTIIKPSESDSTLTYVVIPYYPGKDLRHAIYELEGPDNRETVTSKKALPIEEKSIIAYQLLIDAFLIQQSNLVHCDIKPDNILVNLAAKSVKIIDMDMTFIAGEQYDVLVDNEIIISAHPSPHEGFRGPGHMYSAPESYEMDVYKLPNTFQTDLFPIGVIIASLYSDSCYELDARRYEGTNPVISALAKLSDVLGPDVTSKEGMPDDLFQIARHLAHVDPTQRPINIAFAHGIEKSIELQRLIEFRDNSNQLRTELIQAVTQKGTNPNILELIASNHDLPTLRNQIQDYIRQNPMGSDESIFLSQLITSIDTFCQNFITSLQKERHDRILEVTKYPVTVHKVMDYLNSLSELNKKSTPKKTMLSFSKKSTTSGGQSNEIMRLANECSSLLKNDPQYPNVQIDTLLAILENFYSKVLMLKESDLVKPIIENLHTHIRELKNASPEIKSSGVSPMSSSS